MSNVITYIDKRFVVKNSGILCLTLIFNLSNLRMTILHAKNWFKVARCDKYCFNGMIQTHGSVVKASHSES